MPATITINQPIRGLTKFEVHYSIACGSARSRDRLTNSVFVWASTKDKARTKFFRWTPAFDARIYKVTIPTI